MKKNLLILTVFFFIAYSSIAQRSTTFTKENEDKSIALIGKQPGNAILLNTYMNAIYYGLQVTRAKGFNPNGGKVNSVDCGGISAGIVSVSANNICSNATPNVILIDTFASGNLQWQSSADSIHFTNIPSADSTVYVTHPADSATITYYRLIATGVCNWDTSNVVVVHIYPAPTVGFQYTINVNNVNFVSDSILFPVSTYHWDFGDNTTASDSTDSHVFNSIKVYHVCLTVTTSHDCSLTSCQDVDVLATGVNNILNNQSVQLYPIPATQSINLATKGVTGHYELRIYNVLGQQVKDMEDLELSNAENTSIDLNDISAGTYELVLMNEKEYYSKQFVHIK